MNTPARFVTLRAWIDSGRGAPGFERLDQINWFIRVHREALLYSGTFIPGRGARPTLVTEGFEQAIEEILRREAIEKLASDIAP